MSSWATAAVWHYAQAQGTAKLVLLALAEHADQKCEVSVPQAKLAALCGMSKTVVKDTIDGLIEAGELSLLVAGGSRKPARYRIDVKTAGDAPRPHVELCPDPSDWWPEAENSPPPKPVPDHVVDAMPKSEPFSQISVNQVIEAAGIETPQSIPMFWLRREHREDVATLCAEFGTTVMGLCDLIRRARSEGVKIPKQPARLLEIHQVLKQSERTR